MVIVPLGVTYAPPIDVDAQDRRRARLDEETAAIPRTAPGVEDAVTPCEPGEEVVDRLMRHEQIVAHAGPDRLPEGSKAGRYLGQPISDSLDPVKHDGSRVA